MPLKEIFAPHIGKPVKFGRTRPVRCPRLHLKHFLRAAVLPTPPASSDYSPEALACLQKVYLNDSLGDCVIAGGYHVTGVETGNADDGSPFIATDQQIIADYGAIGGYNPADPSTDQGCDEQTALNYWTQTGFANGTKLCGWLAVDATNQVEVMTAVWLFENLYFGIELPNAWINPFPSADGFVWDVAGDPDPQNGHCIMGFGHNDKGILVDSWGLRGLLTYAAIAKYCSTAGQGELYVMLSPDQIARGQTKAPNGVLWTALVQAFVAMGGNPGPLPPAPPAPPAPPPAPPAPSPAPPAPVPTVVTLDDAIAWATKGLTDNWPIDQ